jgi:predicted nucleic acid-binding protein
MFLVDANVLSEPTNATPYRNALAWLKRHERDIAIDPVTLGELLFGILLLPKGRRRSRVGFFAYPRKNHHSKPRVCP